jgi:chorismate mutase
LDICGQANPEESQSQVRIVVMTNACGRPGRLVARVGGLVAVFAALFGTQARADPTGSLTELVDTAAQRLAIAEPVAAFKWSSHCSVEDPGRVQQELSKLGAVSTKRC